MLELLLKVLVALILNLLSIISHFSIKVLEYIVLLLSIDSNYLLIECIDSDWGHLRSLCSSWSCLGFFPLDP